MKKKEEKFPTLKLSEEALLGMTILELMENIVVFAEDSKLCDEFFDTVHDFAAELGRRVELTERQAVMYSLFVNHYDDRHIRLGNIHHFTGVSMMRLAQFQADINVLEKKRYISRTHCMVGRDETVYYVPQDSMKCLCANCVYKPQMPSHLNFYSFMRHLDTIMRLRKDNEISFDMMAEDIASLVCNNPKLKICQKLTELEDTLSLEEWVLLAVMAGVEMFHNKRLGLSHFDKIFEDSFIAFMQSCIDSKTSELQKMGLIDFGFDDGMVDVNCIQLTALGRKTMLSEAKKKDVENEDIISYKKIQKKDLFYDSEVQRQVERLDQLLTSKSFHAICQRLHERGMKRGFICLFYGAPGTGKTETVMQLAKKTGRNIMQVDFSEIRDKYVGESEKNVKAIFDNYRSLIKGNKKCPILLFNEADAIIGKRLEKVEHSVDNMNNTMQNIILQEMENFEGIMIATTNLETNMDPAFERRFLYKVRFERPTAEVRQRIWQSIIPNISDAVALQLAREHDFSGGQIENIARKQVVDSILYGESDDMYQSLKEYCESESLQSRNRRTITGFSA